MERPRPVSASRIRHFGDRPMVVGGNGCVNTAPATSASALGSSAAKASPTSPVARSLHKIEAALASVNWTLHR